MINRTVTNCSAKNLRIFAPLNFNFATFMKKKWYRSGHKWRYLLIALKYCTTPNKVYHIARGEMNDKWGYIVIELVKHGIFKEDE